MELLSKDKVLEEFLHEIQFANEQAIGYGGVCRDMFSALWEHTYFHFSEGSNLLIPCLHANG